MDKDILSEVIEAEKEIQRCLELERARTREWLDAVKKEAEEAFNQEREKLQGAYTEALAEAIHDAEAKASATLREEEEKTGRLVQVPDEILKRIVMKHIRRILPG